MDQSRPGLALFPASFDPVTNGHLDLVHRARRVFSQLVVGVAHNVAKSGAFPVAERIEMLEDAREIFASHEKKGSWAAKAMNHPHAKTYIANLVVDLTKSQLTQKLSAPLVEKGQRLARALEACDPDILSCHPESSKTVIDAVGDLCSSFSEARASCYIVYLPSVQALDMNQVVTALQAALKRAIEPLSKCDITVESVVEVASLPGSSSRSSRSSALMGQLKATPGIDSSSAEWKTCCWMIKVSAGPLGRRRRR